MARGVEGGRCATRGCVNMRYEKKRYRHCLTCRDRRRDAAHPESKKYRNLRASAKRRGIAFMLTFSEFLSFLAANPRYLQRCGKSSRSLTIDRKDEAGPYSLENIQLMTRGENAAKARLYYARRASAVDLTPDPF